ncbi:MAG: DUF2155 domain-containing protein [Pseudomonadota bacterium]
MIRSCLALSALLVVSIAPAYANETYRQYDTATLRALDKITGRSTDFEMSVGEPMVYGSLRIDLSTCFQAPPEEPPESVAFLKLTAATSKRVQSMAAPRAITDEEREESERDDATVYFSGWMFASSPGLNALEHPVYDIWVIQCKTVSPETLPSGPFPSE